MPNRLLLCAAFEAAADPVTRGHALNMDGQFAAALPSFKRPDLPQKMTGWTHWGQLLDKPVDGMGKS
jgi:hypothetical protein